MTNHIIITCKSVWYHSSTDEAVFFEWIQKIPIITKFDGIRDELYLYIESINIPDDQLRELLALLYRYKINMRQLAIFLTPTNKAWFKDNKYTYWHKQVFSSPQQVSKTNKKKQLLLKRKSS